MSILLRRRTPRLLAKMPKPKSRALPVPYERKPKMPNSDYYERKEVKWGSNRMEYIQELTRRGYSGAEIEARVRILERKNYL